MGAMIPTPNVPDGLQKSFWKKPEGMTGAIFLVAGAAAVVYGWGIIVTFIVAMLASTVTMVLLGAILAALLWLIFSKRSHMMFRVIMRSLTSLFVAVYPIEIIEDKLSQMKKRREKMNAQISEVNGQITTLQGIIAKNAQYANKQMALASYAHKELGHIQDQTEQLRTQLAMKKAARQAQRRQNANIGYEALLNKLKGIYTFLSKYAAHIDFFVEDTEDEVQQKKIEYKTTNTAFGAVQSAMKVMKGSDVEEEMYDSALEEIDNQVGRKLGVMEDSQRVFQTFMDGMSLEEGAVDEQALATLNAYEQKLLTSGDMELPAMLPGNTATPVPVSKSSTNATDSYDPFK
jgi:hypothetical protein